MRHFPQERFIYEICWLFVSKSGKNILKTIAKSFRMAGKADISHDKNVSPQAVTSFKTTGKINDFES